MGSLPPSPALSQPTEQGRAGFGKLLCPNVTELWGHAGAWMDQRDQL